MAKPLRKDANYLKQVREQYENFPYPPRDPAREKAEFTFIPTSGLDCINHYHYAGKRDFSKDFRALIAGGGTGDAVISLGEQLRDTDADIVYLDISDASMQLAKKRAAVRGLKNISWVHGSLLDAPKLVEGRFDYINCIGVLHHLEAPQSGLAALAAVLEDDGVLDIMLYGQYGREGIYQLQKLMRILNRDEQDMQRKVENCKTVLQHLPSTNGFRHVQDMIIDIQSYGDPGIYDLFLHSHDVAYTVPNVYELLATSNLELTHFFFGQHLNGNDLYSLESYFPDGTLPEVMQSLSLPEKQAAAELLYGKIIKHSFYAAKTRTSPPDIADPDNVPFYSMVVNDGVTRDNLRQSLKAVAVGDSFTCSMNGREVRFTKGPNSELFFQYLDGKTSMKDIFKQVRSAYAANEKKPSVEALAKEFAALFAAFHRQDWMLLRHKSVPKARTAWEIYDRFGKKAPDAD